MHEGTFKTQKPFKMKKILYISQEIAPYMPETEASLLARDLPQEMFNRENEIRIFTPKWGSINERRGQLHEVIRLSGMNLIVNDTDHPLIIKVASLPNSRLQVYFIDNDEFFQKRRQASDAQGEDYVDNGERAIFFARGVLETVKKLRWTPDIIHCQGWMSATVPYYLKTAFKNEPIFKEVKIVTTLCEKILQKDLGEHFKQIIDFKAKNPKLLKVYKEPFDSFELGKLAIDFSDGIIVANKQVNKDLIQHAKESGKQVLPVVKTNIAEKYLQFYEKL